MKINDQHQLSDGNIKPKECTKNNEKFKPGFPDSIVIHYTAGSSAESSADFLCRPEIKASAHLVIGRDGTIFQLVSFDTIAWHAGESMYNGRTMLNQYSIGIELDNAGVLQKTGNEYQAWFGTKYPENQVIRATHRNENTPGYWHIFTGEQITACNEICQLLIERYNINTIAGHEEIAPGRKQDPGPAFPLDKLRDQLLEQNRSDEPNLINKDGQVTADFLNIREGTSADFEKIAKPLVKNTRVKVIEEHKGWYKVEAKITGWVSKSYIKID